MRTYKRYTTVVLSLIALTLVIGLGGSVPSAAFAQDLQNDDLLVGAGIVIDPFGGTKGVIWRLRGGSLDKFCESSARYFNIPGGVMVDSQARVIFLAGMQSAHWGLFRCNALGAVPELLAVFAGPFIGDPTPGDPVPFPGQHFSQVSGLHLARAVAGTINDTVSDGKPQLGIEDVYVMVVKQVDPATWQVLSERTLRYHTATGLWDEGPAPLFKECGEERSPFQGVPAINHAGVTYFACNLGVLRRVKDPLGLDISGTLPGDGGTFKLTLSLFGGSREIGFPVLPNNLPFFLDYVNLGHTPSGCPPDPPISGDMPLVPGAPFMYVMTAFKDVVFDEWGDLGLLLASSSVSAGYPYLSNVSEALLDKPGDLSQYFQNSFIGCQAVPELKTRFIMPFWDRDGISNQLDHLVSAPSGIAGTRWSSHLVARLAPGSDRLQVLADRSMFPDLLLPTGLGAYPATASIGGVVIMLRVDSQANVLVTGPDGRRIGVDPATGSPVNDFGDAGFDSGPGTPRFFAIRNAAPGSYSVQNVATADGAFAVHVYSADQAQPVGNHIVASGVAAMGDINNHDFALDPTGGIGFLGLP